jgi:hypothetical protein
MACLYAFLAQVSDFSAIKFGISGKDEPWARLKEHRHSSDNPFRTRLCPLPFFWVNDISLADAREAERALKRVFIQKLPRCGACDRPNDPGGQALDLPDPFHHYLHIVGRRSPSGEWMSCAVGRDGMGEFLFTGATHMPDVAAGIVVEAFRNACVEWVSAVLRSGLPATAVLA